MGVELVKLPYHAYLRKFPAGFKLVLSFFCALLRGLLSCDEGVLASERLRFCCGFGATNGLGGHGLVWLPSAVWPFDSCIVLLLLP